ncbi:cytochrome b [Gallaecimonas sp. GXIMD4217]|uniref:cytochrome b n=1 Tax=Gallaecimonas sp. GXIMD4217 TaxID=3131927 RepID=UPI00311B2D96
MWQNTNTRYGLKAILMHWLSALVVFGLFGLGYWMRTLSYYDSWYQLGPWWHKSVGMVLLAVTLWRLLWKWRQPSPAISGRRGEVLAARLGHALLYLLLLLVMISGYLISTADGRGISVFGWFEVPALVTELPEQEDLAGIIHWYSALSLVVLALGHAAFALKHHFADRKDTLVRMLKYR